MRAILPAAESDIPAVMAVLSAARGIMRGSGNLGQWTDGYPSEAIIREDIRRGWGFVVKEGTETLAYFAFIPSPEPTYARIDGGRWLDDTLPYHVIHRIGSLPGAHGVWRSVTDWCFRQDRNIRIDTHRDNRIMRHCLESSGFRYCGIIYLASGDERLAYQKIV